MEENKQIKLEDLRPASGAIHRQKRVGRGRSSGHGKTSTRGHNGEGQRSGRSRKPGFEGGQMPAYRRIPKLKGFSIVRPIIYAEINVGTINKLNLDSDVIDLELLLNHKVFSRKYEALRVLGEGEINKPLTFKASHFTKSAKEKIEAAGGKIEVI